MTTIRVPRRATRSDAQAESRETRPLAQWRTLDAYVLLGDPGAGKTWAFEDESREAGGVLLKARNVVAGIAPTDLAGRTVFIDGLDEVRAGATDGRVPFNAISRWLHERGNPRFRLSCREADWLGQGDANWFGQVAPGGQVAELHLDPLSDADIEKILSGRTHEVPDAAAFLRQARLAGLTELLRNPLLLDLTVKTAASGSLPKTRAGIYEAACRQLAREHNDEHLAAEPWPATSLDRLLDHAGKLCALLLLSDRRGIARRGVKAQDGVTLDELPGTWSETYAALQSMVFTADADVQAPRHRSIAEFLAGRALAQCVNGGLPIGRVLALMQGVDGFPVEPLRGVWAWLAVHHLPSRALLIATDPLGFVLNGDAASLVADERVQVLHALRDAAEKDPWFRNAAWVSHPFGPLATADMAPTYEALLRDPKRDRGHASFMGCVFDALQHGEPMPSLAPALEAWVEDGNAASDLRLAAYAEWKRCAGFSATKAMDWLQAIEAGAMPDDDDELLGTLLVDVYPAHLTPAQVFDHWHHPKWSYRLGGYWSFWNRELWAQTPPNRFPGLAEAWLRRQPFIKDTDLRDHDSVTLPSKLLAAALEHAGDHVTDTTLYDWLGLCLDEHGHSQLGDHASTVRTWLAARPQRMKAVMAIGLSKATPDEQSLWWFLKAELRLHGAPRPRDWLFWLLDQASATHTPELAKVCFRSAAQAAIDPIPGLDSPSMEQIEAWVEAHKARWPSAGQWLELAWSMPLEHWPGDQTRQQQRQARAQQVERVEQRKRSLQPHIPSLLDGTAPPGLLYHVAVAHEHGFSDLRGDTPLERVRAYLVSDEGTAQAVIAALPRVLDRSDLPTVEEAIALEAKGKQHYIRPAALLAARLACEHDASAALTWPQALAERLVAYYLTGGTGEMPGWYRQLAEQRPDWVAPVLVQYAKPKFKHKGAQFFAGLWVLGAEPGHEELARRVVPQLLEAFPLRASEVARSLLNRSLLPALSSLDTDQAATLVRMKLGQEAMDPAQRICWLVADLPYRGAEAAQELADLVGHNEQRAVILGAALGEQDSLARVVQRLPPAAVGRLIEVLAPITPQDEWWDSDSVTFRRGSAVQALLSKLSSDPSPEAARALNKLEQAQGLQAWKDRLRYSLRTQAATTREASFQAPEPTVVASTLDNQAPANPADLRALVMQHLNDLQAEWQGSDTFALKLFWRDTVHEPKTESDCRDLLLDRLRERLKPLNIGVGRECSAAQDKRADLCAEFMRDGRPIAVPIEVKKEDHPKLWTAWRDQLQQFYTIDPAAQGHGLYLVLWFGVRTTTHPEGLKPQDAEQLRAALEARIPAPDRHRLKVQVLDLSWPAGAPRQEARPRRPSAQAGPQSSARSLRGP